MSTGALAIFAALMGLYSFGRAAAVILERMGLDNFDVDAWLTEAPLDEFVRVRADMISGTMLLGMAAILSTGLSA